MNSDNIRNLIDKVEYAERVKELRFQRLKDAIYPLLVAYEFSSYNHIHDISMKHDKLKIRYSCFNFPKSSILEIPMSVVNADDPVIEVLKIKAEEKFQEQQIQRKRDVAELKRLQDKLKQDN